MDLCQEYQLHQKEELEVDNSFRQLQEVHLLTMARILRAATPALKHDKVSENAVKTTGQSRVATHKALSKPKWI